MYDFISNEPNGYILFLEVFYDPLISSRMDNIKKKAGTSAINP
jgi:hypothetical protein